jgi:hypothetical protein
MRTTGGKVIQVRSARRTIASALIGRALPTRFLHFVLHWQRVGVDIPEGH